MRSQDESSSTLNLTEKATEFRYTYVIWTQKYNRISDFFLLTNSRCENCWSVWSDEYKLKNHIKLEHEIQSCKICNIEDEAFIEKFTREELDEHLTKKHPSANFQCLICVKNKNGEIIFDNIEYLKCHLAVGKRRGVYALKIWN